MCGISGFYSSEAIFSKDDLIRMTDSMIHRGPDASGYFYEGSIGLGHRRLSIIDLSAAANLPMFSQDNNYVIVFNGEIYNFQEIKKELLAQKPVQFRTNSDTEVILEAFILWGVEFVQKLNGMFAIAIYNKQDKTLFMFRDRIGIKPIYYFFDGKNFAFSSELKAVMKINLIREKVQLNYTAINEYLHLGYIPEPHSIYDKIYKFPSGNYAIINESGIAFQEYWNIDSKINAEKISDETEAHARLKDLLVSSVKYRLICDVPFGTFLSGGIDSSLITAIAQRVSSNPVKTFSIGFNDSKFNESHYAKAVAEYLGTNHHEFFVTEKDAIDLIPDLTDVYDEPYGDSSAIPTMLVSKLARQHVTMTLSGDGGDELFLGYGAYKWAKRLNNPFIKRFHSIFYSGLSLSGNKYLHNAQLFNYQNYSNIKSHIFSQENNLFGRSELSALLLPEAIRDVMLDENNFNQNPSVAESQSLFDLNYYLKDDLLVKVDRASMKYSLETRVPILDYRIIEFAYNLPEKLKLNGETHKYLLKKVLYDYIPAHYFDRPKWGFSIPLYKWFRKDLRFLVEDSLSESSIRKNNILNYDVVKDLKERFFNKNQDYLNTRIWLLIMLNKFLEKQS